MSIRAERRRSQRFTYEFLDQVKETARGNWPHVLKQCGIHGRFLKNAHGPCPGCGGEDRFRFHDKDGRGTFYCNQRTPPAGDGFDLLRHFHGWTFPETVREVAAALGIREPRSGQGRTSAGRHPTSAAASNAGLPAENQPAPVNDPDAVQRIVRICSGCSSITTDGQVLRYLRSRGLRGIEKDLPADVLQHLALSYFEDGKRIARYPAMVARVRDASGEMVGLHVTYVSDGEKAVGENSRKMHVVRRGALRGAALRLYAATERLAITEGIENALAVRLATDWPTWATGSAKLLEFVEVPSSVREVTIWADHDITGLNSAVSLERRLISEGREVRIQLPPEPGMDPLDWLRDGHEATARPAAHGGAA